MLGQWFRAVVAAKADLLARRFEQLASVPGHGELTGCDVESRAVELQLPGVHLPAVGLAPIFKLGFASVVVDKSGDGVTHCKDGGLDVLELLDVGLEEINGRMAESREDDSFDVAMADGFGRELFEVHSQVIVREPAQSDFNAILERQSGLLDDGIPVSFANKR